MRQWLFIISLLSLHTGLLVWSAGCHSPTLNEPAHLAAGLSYWEFARFDLYRVNPPLVRSVAALPVVFAGYVRDWRGFDDAGRPVFRIGRNLMSANGERSMWLMTLARYACIPFSLFGGTCCYFWARDLYGGRAAKLSLALWCFSPNILAHAALITPDAGATALGIVACYAFWKWLKQPTWTRALAAGMALGIAELTKMTLVVFYPAWIIVWLAYLMTRRCGRQAVLDSASRSTRWRTEGWMLGIIIAVSLNVLNLGYGFEGTFKPIGEFEFVSKRFGGPDAMPGKYGNRFRDLGLGSVLVPLPENYLRGIDIQQRDFEAFGHQSYLRGEFSDNGWWYYYLYGLAVKVPLGVWMLLLLAVGGRVTRSRRAIRGGRSVCAGPKWRDELPVLVPLFAILVLVSSQSGFSHHFRYVLPIFPFAFVWISQVAEYSSRRMCAMVWLAIVWFVGSSLSVYPHSLSYFNELAGGPRGGHAHMIHSSIDWGQDLLFLKQWVDKHPEATPLTLLYGGDVDPKLVGLHFEIPEFTNLLVGRDSTLILKPGWYAVSVNFLRGDAWRASIGDGYFVAVPQNSCTSLLDETPAALCGYSIYIFEILRPAIDARQ